MKAEIKDLIYSSDVPPIACVAKVPDCWVAGHKVSERKVFDRKRNLIEDFSLFIRRCYHTALCVEKI